MLNYYSIPRNRVVGFVYYVHCCQKLPAFVCCVSVSFIYLTRFSGEMVSRRIYFSVINNAVYIVSRGHH